MEAASCWHYQKVGRRAAEAGGGACAQANAVPPKQNAANAQQQQSLPKQQMLDKKYYEGKKLNAAGGITPTGDPNAKPSPHLIRTFQEKSEQDP